MGLRVGWAVALAALLSGCLAPGADVAVDTVPGYEAQEHCCWQWMRAPDLPVATAAAACTAHQDQAWVLGGVGAQGAALSNSQVYSPGRGWAQESQLPRSPSHATALVVNGRLQVGGGYDAGDTTPSDRVHELLPLGIWNPAASLPDPLAEARGVIIEAQTFLVGGTHDGKTAASQVYAWRGFQGWRDMGDLATPRAGGAFAAGEGATLIAAGGWLQADGPPLASVDAQDPTGTVVTHWFDVPTPRKGAAAAQWDDRLFVIGGTSGDEVSSAVEFLDLNQQIWFRVEPRLPAAVTDACAVVLEDGLHVMGGFGRDGRATGSHWVLQGLL